MILRKKIRILSLKKLTDLEEFMETHNTFDENGKIDLHKLAKAIDDYGPVYFG